MLSCSQGSIFWLNTEIGSSSWPKMKLPFAVMAFKSLASPHLLLLASMHHGCKIAQTALITLSKPSGIVVQSQLVIMVSIVALVFQVRFQLYREALLNRLKSSASPPFSPPLGLGYSCHKTARAMF